jgi:hypothetical protein
VQFDISNLLQICEGAFSSNLDRFGRKKELAKGINNWGEHKAGKGFWADLCWRKLVVAIILTDDLG